MEPSICRPMYKPQIRHYKIPNNELYKKKWNKVKKVNQKQSKSKGLFRVASKKIVKYSLVSVTHSIITIDSTYPLCYIRNTLK